MHSHDGIPKVAGMMPASTDTAAVVIAYGSWVFTWSKLLQPEPWEESIVQSVIGEQWSPNIDPAKPQAMTKGR